MPDVRTDQFKHEVSTWIRALDFLMQENIILKTRLAQVMQHKISAELLEQAESYQNKFLNKDAVIVLLRGDIKEHSRVLDQSELTSVYDKKTTRRHNKLREDMERMENESSRLKSQFNNYLAEAL